MPSTLRHILPCGDVTIYLILSQVFNKEGFLITYTKLLGWSTNYAGMHLLQNQLPRLEKAREKVSLFSRF